MSKNDIIGHNNIRSYFNDAVEKGTLSHAHLIVGDNGIGKSIIAKELAIKLLNKSEIKQYVDIIEFKIAKNKKTIGVDEIRSIIEETGKRPFEGDKKVIIIYEGHKITVQAQNAFLKTIEEPPKGVYIIILCENYDMILDTIKSRCQIHKLNKLNAHEMEAFIDRRYPSLTKEEKETLLSFADGVPGRCEYFMENEQFKSIRNTTVKLLIDINNASESEFQHYSDFLMKYKDMSEEILNSLLSYIRDIIIYKDTGKKEYVINKDKLEYILECCGYFSYNKLEQMIKVIDSTRKSLISNVNSALIFDVMLINMLNS